MDLRNAHYEAMKDQGLTDQEIEEDFKQFCKDLGLQCDKLDEYMPFGQGLKSTDVPF